MLTSFKLHTAVMGKEFAIMCKEMQVQPKKTKYILQVSTYIFILSGKKKGKYAVIMCKEI